MKKKYGSYYFLLIITALGSALLPFAIGKRSFKDWIIVYLVSCIGNYYADKILVTKGYLKYPVRLFSKYKIHLPFDFIHYPLMLLYYNQWTLNSKPIGVLAKVFPFAIPLIIFETIAAKKTKLIKWKKGWTWYHSFISILVKLLICRSIIYWIRVMNKSKISINY
ncbi:CBO0543 family protein [Evansella sp. AB-rgal1]|uniref:CBO0543 family protein n=1 Tax=Evansella sp. AB-rgal1 TaxID=3242696 RepID=UPI00359E261D